MERAPGYRKSKIAYFSMEIGLDERMPTYAGGLGILAGDMLRSCADLEVPVVAVTLLNNSGFFTQEIDSEGNQIEKENHWKPKEYMTPLGTSVTVPIGERDVSVGAWLYRVTGVSGYLVDVILLDTDLSINEPDDRIISSYLYGSGREYRLKQEIVLGIGGVRMLEALGYHVRKYHMNEGHSSLMVLELLNRFVEEHPNHPQEYAEKKVREKCIFTTHTPVPSGHDIFQYDLVERLLHRYVPVDVVKRHSLPEHLSMTVLGFKLSGYINGVAKKHAEVSRSMFPTYSINSITNAVHADTWAADSFKKIYDKHMADWRRDPHLFRYAVGIPDEDIWGAHMEAKKKLVEHVNKECSASMDPHAFTIGFARRMTEYKRPYLLFNDMERLKKIAKDAGGLQIVYAGKSHPEDVAGKKMMKNIISHRGTLGKDVKFAFVPNYGMKLAKKMVSGVDVWLNTPKRPLEASGTSGMKATFNGVLNLSVLDGWWIEGCIEGITGWAVGGLNGPEDDKADAEDLYRKLEKITSMYYKDRKKWIDTMRNSISLNASFFNSHRMVQQYLVDAYMD